MKFAVWLAIVSASVSTLGPAGLVLCVSDSGHVEIETAGDDCCRDAHASDRELAHADRCACVDTPLLHSAARTSIGTERLFTNWTSQPLVFVEPPRLDSVTIAIPSRVFAAGRPIESVDLSSLRSVVLLA
jgi:hypothetical protein